MSHYLVTYDLRKPGRDYATLASAIQRVAMNFSRPLESVWLITSPLSASQIRDFLQQHVDANDGLLVVELARDWATRCCQPSASGWLRANVAP